MGGTFCIILSISHIIDIDLNNVMELCVRRFVLEYKYQINTRHDDTGPCAQHEDII